MSVLFNQLSKTKMTKSNLQIFVIMFFLSLDSMHFVLHEDETDLVVVSAALGHFFAGRLQLSFKRDKNQTKLKHILIRNMTHF